MSAATGVQGYGATGKPRDIGNGYKAVTSQQFTPEQMNLFSQMFGQVSPDSYLSKLAGGDQSQFAQLEEPALRQFGAEQAGLASRFAGMGVGANRSSGAQNAQTSAAQNFASQLQSNRQSLMRQAQQDLFGMSRDLLSQKPYSEYLLEPEEQSSSPWDSILGVGLPIAGAGIGLAAGGLPGAIAGGNIGAASAKGFRG